MSAELLNWVKKILGKLPKTEFSKYDYPLDRLMNLISAPNHLFKPELTVTDVEQPVIVNGFLTAIKARDAPVKANFDRHVSVDDYTTVWTDTIKMIARITETVYLQAPAGQVSKVTLEALKLA